jgi:hypothetical protein
MAVANSTGVIASVPTTPQPVEAPRSQSEQALRRAVTRYDICLATVARLTMLDSRRMTGAEFDSLAQAQDELTQLHNELEQAGQLHLLVAPMTPPAPPQPVFAPVEFRTARGEPATEVPVADWQPVDFDVYERLVTASHVAAAADLHLTTEIAYLQLDRQRAEQVAFERSAYELAAGGDR